MARNTFRRFIFYPFIIKEWIKINRQNRQNNINAAAVTIRAVNKVILTNI
jgi:hypothetical protein